MLASTAIPTAGAGAGKERLRSFSLSVLSRGKGVPPEARAVLARVRELVEADRKRGETVTLETKRLGIEGETRLCVEYDDPAAGARAYRRAEAIAKGVDLVNIEAERCARPESKDSTQGKEEEP